MAVASGPRPAPAATGTLESRPLVHLLVYARNKRLSGRLELRGSDGTEGWIDLWRGRIYGSRTVPLVPYFGVLAYELGLIDTATLDATLLELAKTKRLHGEILVERGSLTGKQRDAILTEQTSLRMHKLFGLPLSATFAFYDAAPAAEEPPFLVDPIGPAWRGLRAHPPTDVSDVLARFSKSSLRMANEGPIARAGFDPDEVAVCDALTSRPMSLAQVRVMSTLPSARVDLLLYFLVITKCAEPAPAESQPRMPAAHASQPRMPAASPGSKPAMPAARGSSPGLPAVNPSMSFRVASVPGMPAAKAVPAAATAASALLGPGDLGALGIANRAASIANEDPFTTLGLADGDSIEAARAAYLRLARLWNPDRLAPALQQFRVEVDKIFVHMTLAHATLTDPDLRDTYLAAREVGALAAAAPLKPRPEEIREIERALAKRDFASAEAASQRLSNANADDAEAQALVVWSSTSAGEATEDQLRAALPLLDRAVNLDRNCERAAFYRGMFHKRLGSSMAAYKDFARVAQLDPKHVDAQRELRILEMRARKGSGEQALEALIAKVKKK